MEKIYETAKISVPKNMRFGGIRYASVCVEKKNPEKFIAYAELEPIETPAEANFVLDMLPAAKICENKKDAIMYADALIQNVKNWDKID